VAVRVAVVDIDYHETLDEDRRVEAVDLLSAADAVVGVVNEGVAVLVDDVLGDDREVADLDLEVRIAGVVAVRVKDDQLIGTALVGSGRDVDAGGSVLLAEDGAVLQSGEIEEGQAVSAVLAEGCSAAAEGGDEEDGH
jgi:hypothetical protein